MIGKTEFELFDRDNTFAQVEFTDNFYDQINVEAVSAAELGSFLESSYAKATNSYVKRSLLIIICDLVLCGKLEKRFFVLNLLSENLNSTDVFLLTIAIKYYTLLSQNFSKVDARKLYELSDDENGDVASEALYWLGFMELTRTNDSLEDFVTSLGKAKLYFLSSEGSTENRKDATYYVSVIELLEALLAAKPKIVESKWVKIEEIMFTRQMYEFNEAFLELDLLTFQLLNNLKKRFKILIRSILWINIETEVMALVQVSREFEKLKLASGKHENCVSALQKSAIEAVSNHLYRQQLSGEQARLENLRGKNGDVNLIPFLDKLLNTISAPNKSQSENPELLLALNKLTTAEEAIKIYGQISDRNKASVVIEALSNLMDRNNNAETGFITGSLNGQEIYYDLKKEITANLPKYDEVRLKVFLAILEEVIRYALRTTIKSSKKEFLFLYSKTVNGKGVSASEQDLQDHMYDRLVATRIAYGFEHERPKFVDGGRVDIVFKTDLVTIPIELKKTEDEVSLARIEQDYISQAQTYTSGYDQLGIFVLLDLTDKGTKPSPNIKDWFHFHHLTPTTSLPISHPDCIISVIIPGNKLLPSSKSKY